MRVKSKTLLILSTVFVIFVHEFLRYRIENLYVFLGTGWWPLFDNITGIMIPLKQVDFRFALRLLHINIWVVIFFIGKRIAYKRVKGGGTHWTIGV